MNNLEKPLVSVCVQTYNHGKYIAKCLDGILMQKTNFLFEIVLGEDESNDETRAVCELYAKNNPEKIKLFLRSRKDVIFLDGRPIGRYNFTENMKACTGKYISLIDGDDYWIDDKKLQKQVDFLETNDEVTLSFTRFKVLNEFEDSLTNDRNGAYFKNNPNFIQFDLNTFAQGWYGGVPTLMFRNSLLNHEIFYKYKYFRDIHIFTELLLQGAGVCLNFFSAVYRVHGGGIYSSAKKLDISRMGSKCYRELFIKNKNIPQLKRKYYSFHKNYVEVLLSQKKYRATLWQALRLAIDTNDIGFLKAYLIKIAQKTRN